MVVGERSHNFFQRIYTSTNKFTDSLRFTFEYCDTLYRSLPLFFFLLLRESRLRHKVNDTKLPIAAQLHIPAKCTEDAQRRTKQRMHTSYMVANSTKPFSQVMLWPEEMCKKKKFFFYSTPRRNTGTLGCLIHMRAAIAKICAIPTTSCSLNTWHESLAAVWLLNLTLCGHLVIAVFT